RLHEFGGRPAEVLLGETQIGQRVRHMCIETRRNEEEIRAKLLNRGDNRIRHGGPEFLRTRAGRQTAVVDVAEPMLARPARARIERPLMRRYVEKRGIGLEG